MATNDQPLPSVDDFMSQRQPADGALPSVDDFMNRRSYTPQAPVNIGSTPSISGLPAGYDIPKVPPAGGVPKKYFYRGRGATVGSTTAPQEPSTAPFEEFNRQSLPARIGGVMGSMTPGGGEGPMQLGEAAHQTAEAVRNPSLEGFSHAGRTAIGGALQTAMPYALPAIVSNPLGAGVGIGTGMVTQPIVSHGLQAVGVPPETAGLAGDIAGLVTGTNAARGMQGAQQKLSAAFSAEPPPKVSMVQALRPRSTNLGFDNALDLAMPEIKASEASSGKPIQSLEDLWENLKDAKQRVWSQYEQIAGPQRKGNVDLSPLADAIEASIPRRLRIENPKAAQAIVDRASAYRNSYPIQQAEELLAGTNAELRAYYAKYPSARGADERANPDTAAIVARGDALRGALYNALDPTGEGGAPAELKRRYGSLMNLEQEIERRKNVAARQAPQSLSEQMSDWASGGHFARGLFKAATFRPLEGLADITQGIAQKAIANWVKENQTTDALIARAFRNYEGTPAPVPYTPVRPRALLGPASPSNAPGGIPGGMPAAPDTSFVRGVPPAPHQQAQMERKLLSPATSGIGVSGTIVPPDIGTPPRIPYNAGLLPPAPPNAAGGPIITPIPGDVMPSSAATMGYPSHQVAGAAPPQEIPPPVDWRNARRNPMRPAPTAPSGPLTLQPPPGGVPAKSVSAPSVNEPLTLESPAGFMPRGGMPPMPQPAAADVMPPMPWDKPSTLEQVGPRQYVASDLNYAAPVSNPAQNIPRATMTPDQLRADVMQKAQAAGLSPEVTQQWLESLGLREPVQPQAPGPAPGMVRLYRVGATAGSGNYPEWIKGSPTEQAMGRWFTPSRELADWYAKPGQGGPQAPRYFVDVPQDVAAQNIAANNPEAAKFSHDPQNEVFLPREWVAKAQPDVASVGQPAIMPPQETPNAGQQPTAEAPVSAGGTGVPAGNAGVQPRVATLPSRRPPLQSVLYGQPTGIDITGRPEPVKAVWSVRELGDVYPSHNPETFEPNPNYVNPEYTIKNQRRYDTPISRQLVIDRGQPAESGVKEPWKPQYHITDNPDGINGAPVIDPEGNALGGNSRLMTLSRVYRYNPEGAVQYRNMLIEKAPQFGLDPNQVAGMKRPVFVREITERFPQAKMDDLVADLNKAGTADLKPSELALADSRRVSPQTMEFISNGLERMGEEGTLPKLLSTEAGPQIINLLARDGVITDQNLPSFVDDRNVLTDKGKERIEMMLAGRMFDDPGHLEGTLPVVRDKVTRMMAPLTRLAEAEPSWDIAPKMKAALNVLQEMRQHGFTKVSDLARQQSFDPTKNIPDDVLRLANHLKNTPPTVLARMVQEYAQHASNARVVPQQDMFGNTSGTAPLSREQAFQSAFEPWTRTLEDYAAPEKAALAAADAELARNQNSTPEVKKGLETIVERAGKKFAAARNEHLRFVRKALEDKEAVPEQVKQDYATDLQKPGDLGLEPPPTGAGGGMAHGGLVVPKITHDYSSTQVNLGGAESEALRAHGATIPDNHLAEDGRESAPHITVKYGLHGEKHEPVQQALNGEGPIAATLGKTSLFSNEDADVLKVDVDSPDLHRLNRKIAALPHTDTHPDYKPHLTVAYLKPGEGKRYAGQDVPGVTGKRVTFNSVTFSGKDGNKTEIPLNGGQKADSVSRSEQMATGGVVEPKKHPVLSPPELVRGSSDIPLSAKGVQDTVELAKQFAKKGGLNRITAGSLARTRQTAQILQNYNPKTSVGLSGALQAWHLGGLEGRPKQQVTRQIETYIRHKPDVVPPGMAATSTAPGESYRRFGQRLMSVVRPAMDAFLRHPNSIDGLVVHRSVISWLHGWLKAGMPADGSADPGEVLSDRPHEGAYRFAPGKGGHWTLQRVDMAAPGRNKPGLYFIPHGDTMWNKEDAFGKGQVVSAA